jgi:nucleotide-binding universal stress UspA family protein
MAIHAMDIAPITPDPYGDGKRPAPKVVVVGCDGSVASLNALRYAAERAGEGGHVVAVHACGTDPSAPGASGHAKDYRSAGKSLVTALEHELPAGVSFEAVLTEGPIPEALATTARTRHADEIIVGARGAHPVNQGLGRVPSALLRNADRPVVVVSPEETSR